MKVTISPPLPGTNTHNPARMLWLFQKSRNVRYANHVAPCANAEIRWDWGLMAGRIMVEPSFVLWGKVGTHRPWMKCFIILICKGQIITELALLEQETVSLHREQGGEKERRGIKNLLFRGKEKKRKRKWRGLATWTGFTF
jgi:hypothetical protein